MFYIPKMLRKNQNLYLGIQFKKNKWKQINISKIAIIRSNKTYDK